jgi:DNA polymerase I-like protein with 3'-5' exonuclease and polymerase domains
MEPLELLALDLESTVTPGGDPSPWITENRPVCGCTVGDKVTYYSFPDTTPLELDTHELPLFKVLVGHNLKFDLAYASRFPKLFTCGGLPLMEYIRTKGIVWDTMLADYLIFGQEYKFPSLEEACERMGVGYTKAIDLSVELPKVGFDIRQIVGLVSYCRDDTIAALALAQVQLSTQFVKDNMSWMLNMMQALVATCEIESNGMHLNVPYLMKKGVELQGKMELLEDDIKALIAQAHGDDVSRNISLDSPMQMSKVFFGGKLEYIVKEPAGVFASGKKVGQPKFKNVRTELILAPLITPTSAISKRKDCDDVWSTSDDVLHKIAMNEAGEIRLPVAAEIAKNLRDFREHAKIAGTYIGNLTKYAYPDKLGKSLIHPQIGMVDTGTGRTASRKPNMQNNPTNDPVNIRQSFDSRFGAFGEMVEIDFKQVEILALAHLSQDQQLIDDILAGRDIHTETGKMVFGPKMTKEQRRTTKTINFGLIYGGSANTLAEQAGVPVVVGRRCIAAFYKRYPRTKEYFVEYFKKVEEELKRNGVFGLYINGATAKKVKVSSPTGRKYTYTEQVNDRDGSIQAPYTQTRNYPIQGLATADMVLNIMGVMWRRLLGKYKDKVYMCGLIHDSLVFDCDKNFTDDFIRDATNLMRNAGSELNKVCPNLGWTLPVKVEVSRGGTLGDMVEQH